MRPRQDTRNDPLGCAFVENTPWANTLQGYQNSWMSIRDILAANVRRIRTDQGISQEALADLAQIDRTYISAVERRLYAISIDKLASIADALEVPAYELLRPSSSAEPAS
jgi:ribosome-binding protein aMBF1 (putative translation factor)